MKDNLLVSIIIPCYNGEKFLQETLESIASQTYSTIEIIAIDDGSTDNTNIILRKFSGIKLLTHPGYKNLGQAASINLGIKNSLGELIAFCDADDIWHPEKLAKQVEVLRMQEDIGLVYTNGVAVNKDGDTLYSLLPPDFQERNLPEDMLLTCYITMSSVLVRKALLYQVGLFNKNLQAQDHDMWLKLIEITKFHYLPEKLMSYRRHASQNSYRRRQWEDGFVILDAAIKRYDYAKVIVRKRKAVSFFRLAVFDLCHNNYFSAIKNFILSAYYDPKRCMQDITKALHVIKHSKRGYDRTAKT